MKCALKKIVLGRIGDAYGIKGWSHVFSFTHPPDNLFHYKNWYIRAYQKANAEWRLVEVESHKTHGDAFVAKIKGYEDRDQALLLKNHTIAVDRTDLPTLKQGEYYWDDLIGFQIINTQGKSFGVVDHFMETGANPVIATRDKTYYLPYTKEVVKLVDLEARVIVVEWDF